MSTTNATHLHVVVEDESEGYCIDDILEPIEGDYSIGDLYRLAAREYGRCDGRVYINGPDGVRPVGWHFIRRDRYEDTKEPYLRGTWVTLLRLVEPARPAVMEPVAVGGAS